MTQKNEDYAAGFLNIHLSVKRLLRVFKSKLVKGVSVSDLSTKVLLWQKVSFDYLKTRQLRPMLHVTNNLKCENNCLHNQYVPISELVHIFPQEPCIDIPQITRCIHIPPRLHLV